MKKANANSLGGIVVIASVLGGALLITLGALNGAMTVVILGAGIALFGILVVFIADKMARYH